MKRIIAVAFAILVLASQPLTADRVAGPNGEYPALTGKRLPDFVRQAIQFVPKEFGIKPDDVVVVTDLQSFLKSYQIKNGEAFSKSPLCAIIGEPTVFVLMDKSLSKDDPRSWVISLEAEWRSYKLTRQEDPGMLEVLAVALVHEAVHTKRGDETSAHEITLKFIDRLVSQGRLNPQIADDYRQRIRLDMANLVASK